MNASKVFELAVDPVTPGILYVATNGQGGMFKSTDRGLTWNPANTGLPLVAVRSLAIDPVTPTTIYAGTWVHGVYKSTDGGGSWSASGVPGLVVDALVIDPATPSTLYAGTSRGVFKSSNSGGSWSELNGPLPNLDYRALAIDPVTPSTLYASTGEGVYASSNSGGSWFYFNSGLDNYGVNALAIDPLTPSTLYATQSGYGVFKNTTGYWSAVNSGLPGQPDNSGAYALAIDPAMPTTLYVGTGDGGTSAFDVFVSTDGGGNWHAFGAGLPNTSIFALAIDPSDVGPALRRHLWRRRVCVFAAADARASTAHGSAAPVGSKPEVFAWPLAVRSLSVFWVDFTRKAGDCNRQGTDQVCRLLCRGHDGSRAGTIRSLGWIPRSWRQRPRH